MKNRIRRELLEKRKKLPKEEVLEKSNEIILKLVSLKIFERAKKIMCYVSFNNEVYTHSFIKEYMKEKDIAVPVIRENEIFLSYVKEWEMKKGKYGILEPKNIEYADEKEIEIAIIPGIAFDVNGNRIGYGKGYFDRLLRKMKAIKIAVAFDFQVLEELPVESHDVKMDAVITEKRIFTIEPHIL